jgi:hypothetical protein
MNKPIFSSKIQIPPNDFLGEIPRKATKQQNNKKTTKKSQKNIPKIC